MREGEKKGKGREEGKEEGREGKKLVRNEGREKGKKGRTEEGKKERGKDHSQALSVAHPASPHREIFHIHPSTGSSPSPSQAISKLPSLPYLPHPPDLDQRTHSANQPSPLSLPDFIPPNPF